MPETITEPDALSPPRGRWWPVLVWLAMCVVLGLLIAPLFYALPPRWKLIGLHAWGLSATVAAGCAGAAVRQGIRSRWLVGCVSVFVSLGALLLLAQWGFTEMKQASARRVPMIPLPQQVGSPEEISRALQIRQELAQAIQPTFTDFQRHRMNPLGWRRIRPLALWGGELLIAAIVSGMVSGVCFRNFGGLKPQGEPPSDQDATKPDPE